MKRKNFGTILIIIGGLFLGAALALILKNLWEQKNAEDISQKVMESLLESLSDGTEHMQGDSQGNMQGNSDLENSQGNGTGTVGQDKNDSNAGNTPTLLPVNPDKIEIPDYILNPHMDMPEQKIDGIPYIGYLQIEALDLKLPIASKTTYPYLKKVPCRYEGSAYFDNLVIGAHNYNRHFGRIGQLSYGDKIIFTDIDGNQFLYEVATIEILQPTQVEDLCAGEWPLTLYTCTLGGKTRVVVRCEKQK